MDDELVTLTAFVVLLNLCEECKTTVHKFRALDRHSDKIFHRVPLIFVGLH